MNYGIQLGKVVFVGLLGVVLTVDFVVGLQALYYWQLDRIEASEDASQQPANLAALTTGQEKRLTEYRMLDAEKGTVCVPIARAMKLVVDELSRDGGATTAPEGESR